MRLSQQDNLLSLSCTYCLLSRVSRPLWKGYAINMNYFIHIPPVPPSLSPLTFVEFLSLFLVENKGNKNVG